MTNNLEDNNLSEPPAALRASGQSNRIVKYIGVAAAIVAGLTVLLKELPDLFSSGEQAYVALAGMFSPGSSRDSSPQITNGQLARPNTTESSDTPVAPAGFRSIDPGPKPRGDCHLVSSTDLTVSPPVYKRTWECK
jgi:hypothetical protein